MTERAFTFSQLLEQRLTRRDLLQSATAVATLASMPSLLHAGPASSLSFSPIPGSKEDKIVLPAGYTYDVVARWGDSLFSAVPDLDTSKLVSGVLFEPGAAERQRGQFGQNCDAIHFF